MSENQKPRVHIYTDGSALNNPGPTGAGIVLKYGAYRRELSIGLGDGTNNTAELQAMTRALQMLNKPCRVFIYSDSQYAVNIANKRWNASSNLELWDEFFDVASEHLVTCFWIRKDSHELNKRAHSLAVAGAKNQSENSGWVHEKSPDGKNA